MEGRKNNVRKRCCKKENYKRRIKWDNENGSRVKQETRMIKGAGSRKRERLKE